VKGQISIIEVILSSIALLVAFNMMITAGEYQTKWEEAASSLQGRDILTSADRLGKLHDYPFSPAFKTQFLSKIDAIKDAVVKNETQGTVKNTIYVACDCNNDQYKLDYITNILSDVKFNTRGITAEVCSTSLPTINNCGSGAIYPNALIIWRYDALTPHIGTLTNFVNDGNGLIEIADVPNSRVNGGADDHEGQKIIFGLKATNEGNPFPPPTDTDEFLTPRNVSQLPYQSYKWFYHSPYLLTAPTSVASVPMDTPPPPVCATVKEGNLKFQDDNFKFWICTTTSPSVFFDTDRNNKADLGPVIKGQKFSIGNSNFKLNYIDSTDKIRLSFKPDYLFNDFIRKNNAHNKLAPADNDKNKVLLSMGFWDATKETPRAGIIFNNIGNGKAAWMADFARDAEDLGELDNLGDDYKQLLASMILSISNKKTKETFRQIGQITSYINVNNTDMLEIYKIDLSIGKPF